MLFDLILCYWAVCDVLKKKKKKMKKNGKKTENPLLPYESCHFSLYATGV